MKTTHTIASITTTITMLRQSGLTTVCLFLLTGSILFATGRTCAQEKDLIKAKRIADESKSEEESEETINRAIRRNEELIARYPDGLFVPTVMFQLTELYVKKAKLEYRRKMEQYEKDLEKFDSGLLPTEPILPKISLKKSIELAYQLLEKYPNISFKGELLYRLALCHLDEGNQEKAKEFFQRLIYEVPSSEKVSEAHFRLGEYYFNKRDFHKAIQHYSQLLERWDDPYFNMSLYKLGWSYYNINDYPNAISTFIYLLSDINLLEETDTELLGKTKADVRNEAIDYVAHCFSEFGGPKKAKFFLKEKGTQDYIILIFLKLGEIYQRRNFYSEAIETYEILLELFPFYPRAPYIQKLIVECYEKDMEEEKAIQAKERLVDKYGPGSRWLAQFPTGKTRKDALSLAEDALYSVGTYYQAKAQEKNRQREYRKAIDKYEKYLKKFHRAERAYKVNYYLADCYYEVGDYDAAADEYYKVMFNYDQTEFKEEAAYNRILSYYQLLKGNIRPDSLTFYLEDFIGADSLSIIPIKVGHEAQANLIKACNDFARALPQSDKLQEVLMKYGETLYDLKKYELAIKIYDKVVTNFQSGPFYPQAFNMIAQCYFKDNQYDQAETWYKKLAQAFPDSSKYVAKANTMIASANFKKAEDMKERGKILKSAGEFLKVAFQSLDKEISRVAIIEASTQFEKGGDVEKAALALERYVEKFPDLQGADELLLKAALLREKMEQWEVAAEDYLKLATTYPTSQYAPKVVFSAGRCYEILKNWDRAKEIYERFIYTFNEKQNADEFIEALCKIAEMYYNEKDMTMALRGFQRTIAKYRELKIKRINVDEYIPAKAQFMVGEIHFDNYKKIKLVPPLQQNLRRKQESFATVLKAYADAAKFKVADWTTAASYKIGMSFEEFGQAFLEASPPTDFTEEELQAYKEKIKEKVIPFKEKALETYKANVRQAEKNNISNSWVEESKKRMEALIIELGLSSRPSMGSSQSVLTGKSNLNE